MAQPDGDRTAALVALVQTMIPHIFYTHDETIRPREIFADQIAHHDPAAMGIANALTQAEIDTAFAWVDASQTTDDEVALTPIRPHLTPTQQLGFRVSLTAIGLADDALEAALALERGSSGNRTHRKAQARTATEGFLRAMANDVKANGHDVPEARSHHINDEFAECLPEPWRRHALTHLANLKARFRS